uniref:ATP synthase complex subunit 8 n=1 Tax=Metacarcinus magister TaxID=29965 RepID=A0A7G7WQE0_METMG|nr:ATP synthase F0 subunit 8 [Metacarcinus magister]QNH68767.1 ATP synthase F0 subunit 8 [Metacarcinus magister]
MPQMAPLMWLYLYLFFLLSFMIFIILNFFIKPYSPITTVLEHPSINQKSWKW